MSYPNGKNFQIALYNQQHEYRSTFHLHLSHQTSYWLSIIVSVLNMRRMTQRSTHLMSSLMPCGFEKWDVCADRHFYRFDWFQLLLSKCVLLYSSRAEDYIYGG